ncbi:hypothetical protein JEZ23_21060 [Pseudomonas aeruginosa]|nr:hypothetical protein [Pseudomonas aeruginosa]HCF5744499.1 hypothetical protein [Pseudomonas aeruginosa]
MTAGNNSTFCGASPTWANACVGNNGSPGYHEYATGFSKAANTLIDQVLAGRGLELNVDDLVYPVCFNMRHSVELRLKEAIESLGHVARARGRSLTFDLAGSHDIGNIWKYFRRESEVLDRRYIEVNESLDSTISDLADVDATGQVFRYPESNESHKHLTEISLINFFNLKVKFGELEDRLELLSRLNVFLREEYCQGTFTSKFSRALIYKLARDLPHKSSWVDDSFLAVKASLMAKYEVGSKELARAIDKIKSHYYLAAMIDAPLPLKGMDREQILVFFDLWVPQNPHVLEAREPVIESYDSSEGIRTLIAEMVERADVGSKVWKEISHRITPEFLAGINALFYFARDKTYVEFYDRLYAQELAESNTYFQWGGDHVKNSFMHIYQKANAMDNMLISLYALGHASLAEEILERYGVGHNFDWLESARSGQLFDYPEYAQY